MADDRMTLLQIAVRNGSDGMVGIIDEASLYHPEIRLGTARTIRGTSYKTLVRVANPTVSFRDANEGVEADKSETQNRRVECFIAEPRFEVDAAVAQNHEDGVGALLADEAAAQMQALFALLSANFYYGTNSTHGNAKGFPGLIDAYDSANMYVDAGGTTASTGSSVWLVKFGAQHVQWVYGAGGELKPSEVREETLLDSSSKKFRGYVQDMLVRPGLQVGSKYSVCRIKKITADSGKTLTDTMIYDALEKFPVGIEPDVILMTKRSRAQLRASRTATNQTGEPAPIPTSVEGIPIAVTESIANTEDLAL